MSKPGRATTLGVTIGENDDGVWCAVISPTTQGLDIEVTQAASANWGAVYRAAGEAGWSADDRATLNYVWPELRRRAVAAMRQRNPIGFWIGGSGV